MCSLQPYRHLLPGCIHYRECLINQDLLFNYFATLLGNSPLLCIHFLSVSCPHLFVLSFWSGVCGYHVPQVCSCLPLRRYPYLVDPPLQVYASWTWAVNINFDGLVWVVSVNLSKSSLEAQGSLELTLKNIRSADILNEKCGFLKAIPNVPFCFHKLLH